jgi:hypothetical protein
VAFESRRVNLAKYSRSDFALVYLCCVQVRIFLLLAMPMRAASGKSRLLRDGFRTVTHRLRVADERHSLIR